MLKKIFSTSYVDISFNPFGFFCVFLISLSLISYFSLSLTAKLWIGTMGLLIPGLLALGLVLESRWKDHSPKLPNFRPADPSVWAWCLLIVGFILTRLYHFQTIPFWPTSDEGIFLGLGLSQLAHWHWHLLWAEVRFEPLMVWLLGAYFKLVTPSLSSVRLLTLCVSLLTSVTAYKAARFYFSKSTSFFFCVLLSFCFWNLTLSRLCILVTLVPVFQYLSFMALGSFLRSTHSSARWKNLLLLSAIAGIGFYTWTNWIFVWASLGGLLVGSIGLRKKEWPYWTVYGGLTSLAALPLLWARLQPGGTHHLAGAWTAAPLASLWTNLKGLFWNGFEGFPYGSNWGGVLNSILTSLILIGFLHVIQTASRRFLAAIAFVLICYSLPEILSNGLEMYRALPLLGLLLLAAAWKLSLRQLN